MAARARRRARSLRQAGVTSRMPVTRLTARTTTRAPRRLTPAAARVVGVCSPDHRVSDQPPRLPKFHERVSVARSFHTPAAGDDTPVAVYVPPL